MYYVLVHTYYLHIFMITGMQGSPIGAGQVRGIPLSEKLLPQVRFINLVTWL